ncbi:MAG: hypothetical protein ACK5JD_13805 [Mangrovibacterium sp.]
MKTKFIHIIPFLILLISCNQKQKQINTWNERIAEYQTETGKTESDLILDTLVFNENLNGKELTEKYDFGQTELDFYKEFISDKQILEKQILTDEHTKTEITYLGKLMDLDNQNFYHVLTNFKIIGIGEMESPRGISNIAFINENMDKAIIYRMGMPDELPKKIEDKILYFNHESEKIGISILVVYRQCYVFQKSDVINKKTNAQQWL